MEISQERFVIRTMYETHIDAMRDIVIGSFRLLRYTPIKFMGINKLVHIMMDSDESWNDFGHRLVPKDLWQGILKNPGTRSLAVQGERIDKLKGYLLVTIQPSTTQLGIDVSINDHYEVDKIDTTMGCDEIINILEEKWPFSIKTANDIIDVLYSRLR